MTNGRCGKAEERGKEQKGLRRSVRMRERDVERKRVFVQERERSRESERET